MGAFAYESVYIGFPLMYHAFGPDDANTDGFHVIELAVSRNLRYIKGQPDFSGLRLPSLFLEASNGGRFVRRNWTRLGPRIPKRSWDNNVFIPNSRMGAGAYDLLGVSSPSAAVTLGDTLYMFYTAIRYRAPDMAPAELACADCPSGVRPADQGAINLATLRRDGYDRSLFDLSCLLTRSGPDQASLLQLGQLGRGDHGAQWHCADQGVPLAWHVAICERGIVDTGRAARG